MGDVTRRAGRDAPRKPARHILLNELLRKHSRAAGASPRAGLPLTVGDTTDRVSWESGGVSVGDAIGRQIVVDGQFSTLEATALSLQRGDVVDGYFKMGVDSAELTPRRGGLAKLTIRLVPSTSFGTASAPLRETIEIDMAQIEKPILTHKKIADDGMAAHLALWRDGDDEARRAANKYLDDAGNEQALTSGEIVWAEKIRKGVESFLVFAPVVTQSGVYDGRPDVSVPGFIDTPPVTVGDYVFLKTADKVAQNQDRTWTRVQQWTGADEWDTDIYTAPEPEA